ncbi:ATP-binding protein [Luteimonas sp. RD2P54]|uniref:histidine kinase n=1 Tax=Luteimonas endophytica TaxID=3042023 RepID=A0ABT6JCV1_9GAMM|nr:ATP-binding protein [Luteimonas endophytica]MDH5824642.1 ATP-binding protein [Luteimonas endophytica]
MHPELSANPLAHWRLAVLGLAVVAIVVAPFLLLRAAAEDSRAAWERVMHAREVEATVHALSSGVRNLEATALAMAAGIDDPVVHERIALARANIPASLQRLQRLTRDNPQQQLRAGALQSTIALRTERLEQILAAGAGSVHEDMAIAVARYPIHDAIEELIAEEQALADARQARAERLSARAGQAAWAAMAAQLVLLGALLFLAGRQIASRLSAERDARSASGRAAAVLDTVREPIVLVGNRLEVVMHNAAFAELYGVEEDMRGQPLAELGGGAWRHEETLRRLRDVLSRNRELWDHEQVQKTADGIERTMLINARRMPLPDSEGMVALVTASDVSAQKASERQIRELNRQLQGKVEQISDVNRELEAFSYSVSHDLRAPLRHIAGFGDKLARHLGDSIDDKGSHYLGVIVDSAKRMSSLIDDLLVYSRLGRSALRLQLVDMQSLVAETRSMLDANNAADTPQHRIVWKVGDLPVVVGDENMLRQVWLNLLGNAVKYSRHSEPAQIEVSCSPSDDGGQHFRIADNGAGFDMKYAGKLFGVFQRLHAASEFQGTGIGLASVRRVIGRHGGRVWAEAEPGNGATFHFILPAAGDLPATTEKAT